MSKSALLSIALGLLIHADLGSARVDLTAEDKPLRERTIQLVKPYVDNDIIVGLTRRHPAQRKTRGVWM
jgi:hypothetical protein